MHSHVLGFLVISIFFFEGSFLASHLSLSLYIYKHQTSEIPTQSSIYATEQRLHPPPHKTKRSAANFPVPGTTRHPQRSPVRVLRGQSCFNSIRWTYTIRQLVLMVWLIDVGVYKQTKLNFIVVKPW